MSVADVVAVTGGSDYGDSGQGRGQGRDFERLPPQDITAEQCVLGGMLLSKDAIADVVEVLRPTDFYRPAHQTVFDTILDLYGRGEPADPVTVAAELTRHGELARVGGAPYLHTLIAAVPTAANAGYYAQIVHERAILRRLVEAGTRIVQLGYGAAAGEGGGDVDDIVDRAQAAVYDVTERRSSDDYLRLEEVLQGTLDEIEAISSRDGGMVGVPTGFKDLDELTNGLHPGQMVIVAARPAIGKALALDIPLVTPDGWTTMGEVQVGDRLIGADGRPTTVVAATNAMLDRPCYQLVFSDGSTVVADAQHLWRTSDRAARRQQLAEGRDSTAVRTTEQIAATVRCDTRDRRPNHSVGLAAPLQLPEAELPLPPYALGVWLGDGHSASARFTTADDEVVLNVLSSGLDVVHRGALLYSMRLPVAPVAERSCVVCGAASASQTAQVRTCGRRCGGGARGIGTHADPTCPDCGRPSAGLRRCQSCHRDHGTVAARLRRLGVLDNKHIPSSYLRASEQQRRDLLAGLLDTDGYCNRSGTVQFSATNRRLAEDTRELILSLGYRATMTTKQVAGRSVETGTAYTVTFTPADKVFRLSRKVQRQRTSVKTADRRYITEVRRIESVPVRCVQVDNADGMFLAGRQMIPTHNSTLGLDFARSAAIKNGLATVIFSLEMSRNEITMRLLSAEARVPLHHMRSGTMSDDDWARLARRMGEVAEAPLFIDDSPNLTMMEIRAKARRLKQRHDLRLIVLDYMQLMSSPRKVESRQQEVSELSRNIKLLAKELEVPVIAISQLNRNPEQRADKRPQLSDLRESGAIEMDADVVVLLHREDAYEKESPRAGEADLIVAKHRNGPTATVTVAFQGHYSRFVDMSPA